MFSMYILPVLLCLVPLAVTLWAWQLGRSQTPALTSFRMICFNTGVAISAFAVIVAMCYWLDAFPKVHLANGSESNAWLELGWRMAIGGTFLSMILALFGRGWPRIMLVLSGVIFAVLAQ